MKRWSFSPEANADLAEAWIYWFLEADAALADRIESEIYEASDLLAEQPMMGHLKPDWTSRPVRFWLVESYWIVYRAETVPLEIVRVLHTSRDIPPLI